MKLYLLLIISALFTLITSLIVGIRKERKEKRHEALNSHRPTWGYTDKRN